MSNNKIKNTKKINENSFDTVNNSNTVNFGQQTRNNCNPNLTHLQTTNSTTHQHKQSQPKKKKNLKAVFWNCNGACLKNECTKNTYTKRETGPYLSK